MNTLPLAQFSAVGALRTESAAVWINPMRVAYLRPRYRGPNEEIVGTRIYFDCETMLDVTEHPQLVVARIEGRLPEPWHMLEDEHGIDGDYKNALADVRL